MLDSSLGRMLMAQNAKTEIQNKIQNEEPFRSKN